MPAVSFFTLFFSLCCCDFIIGSLNAKDFLLSMKREKLSMALLVMQYVQSPYLSSPQVVGKD